MASGEKVVEYYERDGAVYRRVRKDLGNGIRVTTSDTMEHPDIKVFMEEQPDARVRGFHPETEQSFPSPTTFTLDELPDFLAGIDSVDVILKMRSLDERKMAPPLYEERLQEILGDTPFAEDADEDDDDGDVSDD